MNYALAICLLCAAGADPSDADRRSAGVTDDDIAASVQKLFESLNRDIEESSHDPRQKCRLAPMYATRGWLLLHKGELEKALSDFDAAIAIDPQLPYARSGRAEYFRRTGDLARADDEMRLVNFGNGTPYKFGNSEGALANPFGTEPISAVEAWLVVAIFWVMAIIFNAVAGWRQKVEASESFAWLVWVAAYFGVLQILPLLVWAAFVSFGGIRQIQLVMAAGMTVLSLALTVPCFLPPVRLPGTKERLPRVADEPFLARVAELAAKMNVQVPIVRLWPSLTGSQKAHAYVGTIQAPQLVVTDGILRRLAPAERDAIVAHELAHIANRSLFLLATILPVSCAGATFASAFFPLSIVWPFGLALLVGLRRMMSRPFEIDCDRRAARVIGFRETAAALAKIHAVHTIDNTGLLSLLVYATATHPSREIRLAALRDAAPESDQPEIDLSDSRIRWQRRLTIAALVVWLATVSGAMAAAILKPQSGWLAIPLWMVALAPWAIIFLSQRKRRAVVRKRMGSRPWWFVPLVLGGLLGASLFIPRSSKDTIDPIPFFGIQVPIITSLLALVCIVGVIVWLALTHGRRKLRHDVAVAAQLHDFRRVLELARQSPKAVSRDHILRYNVALARTICDDRPAAITMFEGLWQDKPGFPLSAFPLAQLLLDSGEPERALAVAEGVVKKLPRDAGTHALEARIRRRLRQLDEAQAACDRVLALEPEEGTGLGIAAAIALDRGDHIRARELIDQALAASPGESHLLLIHAEIILETEPFEAARPGVEEALATVRKNPLVFLRSDISRLEQKLAEREGCLPILQSADPVA